MDIFVKICFNFEKKKNPAKNIIIMKFLRIQRVKCWNIRNELLLNLGVFNPFLHIVTP